MMSSSFYEAIRASFPEKFCSDVLYHYTSKDVLGRFLADDARLFCTDVDQLNDEAEFTIGVECAMAYLKKLYGQDDGLYRSVQLTIEKLKEQNLWHGWVMSFTDCKDDLGQWRAYTDPKLGGYSVGFDEKSLVNLIAKQNADWHAVETVTGQPFPMVLYLYPCFYEGHDNVEVLLDLMFKESAPALARRCVYEGAPDGLKLVGTVVSLLQLFASIYKQESFYAERETRIVIQNQFAIGCADVTAEKIGGKDRIAMPLFPRLLKVRDVIRSVRRSPHGDRKALEEFMRNKAVEYGCKYECLHSGSTFRG